VGGHMLGAWAGHVTAQRDMADAVQVTNGRAGRDLRHRKIHDPDPLPLAPPRRNVRAREIPLALVMVALTTLTLWSLGQAIVVEPEGTSGLVTTRPAWPSPRPVIATWIGIDPAAQARDQKPGFGLTAPRASTVNLIQVAIRVRPGRARSVRRARTVRPPGARTRSSTGWGSCRPTPPGRRSPAPA